MEVENIFFYGGINQSVDANLINSSETPVMSNFMITERGMESTSGYAIYDTTLDVPTGGLYKIINFYHANLKVLLGITGNDKLAIMVDYDSSTNHWFEVYPGSSQSYLAGIARNDIDTVNYELAGEGVTVLANQKNPVVLFSNTEFRPLKKNGSTSPANANNQMYGKYVELYNERLWVAGDYRAPNRLYFSNDMDIEDFTVPLTPGEANRHGGFIDLVSFDGGEIIGLKAVYDDLIVFKSRNVWRISGYGTYDFTAKMIFNTINGEVINNSIAVHNNFALWMTTEGIHLFNGASIKDITPKVQTIFNGIDMSKKDKIRAITWKNQYILAIPYGNTTENNMLLIYDVEKDIFTVRESFDVKYFSIYKDKLLFVNGNGYLYELDKTGEYNDKGFSSEWQTGFKNYSSLKQKKKIREIHIAAEGTGALLLLLESEKQVKNKLITVTGDNIYKVKVRNKGKRINIKIIRAAGSGKVTLKQAQIYYDRW